MAARNGSEPGFRLRLLDIEPDLARFMSSEEREEARRITVAIMTVGGGVIDLDGRLANAGAFGAIVVDGVLMHRWVFGVHPALRLLGPGDVLARQGDAGIGPLSQATYRAPGSLRVALLDDHVLAAGQRFPRLFAGLHVRMGEQHHRLATQLVICQLPRVEERILGLLWLLAETWGRVTPNGTAVPITLTHDALGECVGARRPTVSLALKELADRGAVVRQPDGWLLLEPLADTAEAAPSGLRAGAVTLSADPGNQWRAGVDAEGAPSLQALREVISTLHESHAHAQDEVRRSLARSRSVREHNAILRQRLARALSRRPPAG